VIQQTRYNHNTAQAFRTLVVISTAHHHNNPPPPTQPCSASLPVLPQPPLISPDALFNIRPRVDTTTAITFPRTSSTLPP
jgi:hypothetical protein